MDDRRFSSGFQKELSLMMPDIYDYYVTKYSDNFKRVLIDKEKCDKIEAFAKALAQEKAKEAHHQKDSRSGEKRFITGLMGEAALEKLLSIQIIEWSIGVSENYHHPDIPNYNVGIKTVEQGKFPIIFKRNEYAQIICIRSGKTSNLVFVCGLATPAVLNRYQCDDMILDSRLRARGTKTAFYGFEQLQRVISAEDIDNFKKNDKFCEKTQNNC